LILHDGREIASSGKFYRSQRKVRFEPEEIAGLTEEIELFDFERPTLYRLIPRDRIYFQSRPSPLRLRKAVLEGWIPPPPDWLEERIPLREVTWNGRPARLSLRILRAPSGSGPNRLTEHSLLWTDKELDSPLRVVYSDPQSHPVIIEFHELASVPLDPALFLPPADYVSLNPF
jgi:hypothetical protein